MEANQDRQLKVLMLMGTYIQTPFTPGWDQYNLIPNTCEVILTSQKHSWPNCGQFICMLSIFPSVPTNFSLQTISRKGKILDEKNEQSYFKRYSVRNKLCLFNKDFSLPLRQGQSLYKSFLAQFINCCWLQKWNFIN